MGVSGLDAGNDPRVDVVVPTQPHRRGSHVGAVDERFSLSANVVESIVGEQVDGTLAVARNGAIRSASAAIEVTSTTLRGETGRSLRWARRAPSTSSDHVWKPREALLRTKCFESRRSTTS